MKPFHKDFVVNTINDYKKYIKKQEIGKYKITYANYTQEESSYLYKEDNMYTMDVPTLYCGDEKLMQLHPKEIQSSYETIKLARGKVAIVGLGLGYVAREIATKDDVSEVIVYEISNEIIEMYNNNFESNDKIKIIHGNAYEAEREHFDYFYVDIYSYTLGDKMVEDYVIFNELHDIEEYAFWGIEHFLLSCRYDEIVWVYIPENWMTMSKSISASLDSARLMDKYVPLDPEFVSDLLAKFKIVLNEEE